MVKKSFPGMMSETEAYAEQQRKIYEKKAAREKRKKQREQRRAERREFNNKIGPAARLAIARRGLAIFVAYTLMGVGIGSAAWAAVEKDEISYPDAFKRAYSINTLATEDFACPILAMLFLVMAAGGAFRHADREKSNAKKLVNELDSVIKSYKSYSTDTALMDTALWWSDAKTKDMLDFIKRLNDSEYINAVQRAIIKKYVSENPIMFDRVLSYRGRNYYSYSLNPIYAMTVIKAHLDKHPEDYKKILATYDETSIPRSLVRKYGEKKR